jgi:amino acid adenylation domain-containing protein
MAEEWTRTESSIRSVLEGLSPANTDRIRRGATIYQLGFDSISAVQIASALRKLGHKVVASDIIEYPTCQSLGAYLDTRGSDSGDTVAYDLAHFQSQVQPQISAHGIAMDIVEVVMPCTPLQSAMMAQFLKSEGRDYFNFIDFELGNGVSLTTLAESWRAVSLAHPLLRTGVVPVEHPDSVFAMVQYHKDGFVPPVALIPAGRAETFDLQSWRFAAGQAAKEVPASQLWSVAVVEAERGMTMHLAIHHVLYDAYSLQAILDDLSRASVGGPVLSRPGTQEAVTDILGHVLSAAESSAGFWKSQADKVVINGFPVMTPLRQGGRSILTESTLSTASLTTLEEAASRSGHTLQVILQAAWTRVLSAYLGEQSVVFGVVLSGRNTETTRHTTFPCISTLPVIATNTASNRSLLDQMLQYNTDLYRQQHQPLTNIQQWLGYPDTRLFDTLLVYQKLDRESPEERPWRIVNESASVDYPVSIEVEPKAGGQLGYQVTFFSDVLGNEQARLLLKQFDAVVGYLAHNPSGHEEDLFKSSSELFSVLPPEVPEIPTTVKFLHQFVEIQASRAPDNTALNFVERFDQNVPVGRRWTYKELDANGNRVAQMLLPHTKPGDIVAVYFDKCPEAYFSILGILKAGCAFVALDPAAPRSRNEFILQDSGASVLVTSRERKDSGELTVAVPVLGLDQDALAGASPDSPTLQRDLEPNDVCYCLYTSGTTGTPKGCEITHDNAVQCMLAFQHIFQGHWRDDSKWLQFASLHFDVSVLEQYWSWSVGITLVAAPRDLILEDLAGTISRLEITHIDLTPSLARLLHPDDVPSLCRGVFITGGEALKQEILDVWGSKEVIYNFYGPTEATIGVTVFPRVPVTGRASNIGQQFINVGSYVLKPGTEQPVLRGGVGELCVSGPLVGKGYLRREDLTSEKFPTLQHFRDRVYRTGDLVRVLHNGCFDFLGRADDQVKLRGQRLEIGEINHCIRKGVDEVEDVATLVVRNEAQQKDLLVSFIVSGRGRRPERPGGQLGLVVSPEAAKLCWRARHACRSKLPGYMVPTYVLQLPFIPLSANNKAELKELRRFFASLGQDKLMTLSSSTGKAREELSTTGRRIARALVGMQEIHMSSVAPDSSIFELGVDSISVIRFSRALKKEGFAHASPSLILQHPLIGDLAAALEEHKTTPNLDHVAAARQLVQACAHKHSSVVCQELGIVPGQIEYTAPCSPLQQGMISRSATESAYFNTFQFTLSPNTRIENLKNALQNVIDALPILRTKFVGTTDGYVQVAVKREPLPCSEIQLKAETSVEDVIRKTRDAWVACNKECLSRPLEAILIDSGDAHLLVLHIFHGLYDANSLKLILDRVVVEYLAALGGEVVEPVDLTPAPAFLDALCYGPLQDFDSSKAFWINHFEGAALVPSSSHEHSSSVITSQRKVPFKPIEALRTSLGVTHQALVQAAWVSVLASHLSEDPTIGIIVSGRNIELDGADRVVGPLFNTLPFHARIIAGGGLTWSSLVRQCHDFNTTVLPFQHVPLSDIQKWCSRGQPLFNTLFSFQREEKPVSEYEPLWTVVDWEPNADYPLALEATLGSDGDLDLLLVAQETTLDTAEYLEGMMDGLEQALAAMAQDPGRPVSSKVPISADRLSTTTTANGYPTHSVTNGRSHKNSAFTWTRAAMVVRNEIAALADIHPEAVDGTTPLFGLGLDSIDVIKLSARLKKQGLGIKTSELIKAQTIEAIIQHLQTQTLNGVKDSSREREISEVTSALREHLGGELADGEIVLPTTPLQESMVVEMVESGFQLYFNHDILEIAPSIDIVKLKEAWKAVVAGSPVLRTKFLPIETASLRYSYCQVVGRDPSVHMADVQLDSIDELAKVCETATIRARKGAGRADLLQLVFASLGSQKFLVLSIAHALYDGWSLNLIHRDVRAAYEGRYRAQSLESYIALVHGILFPEHGDATSFWSGFLRGATPTLILEKDVEERGIPRRDIPSTAAPEVTSTPLPEVPITTVPAVPSSPMPDLPDEGVPSVLSDPVSDDESGAPTPSSSELTVFVEEDLGQRHVVHRCEIASTLSLSEITTFCKTHAITMQTLGQACWAALLAAKTGCLDVTFGVVLSCRDTEALEQLVFPTMNTVAVRSVLHSTISSWLRYMQDNMSSISSHQHLPLREAQKLAGCNGPLFNTLFIQQRGLSRTPHEGSGDLMQSVGGISAVEYPVCVEMELAAETLVWRIACDAAYASQDETSKVLQDLDRVLGHVIHSPEAQAVAFLGQEVSICGLAGVVLKAGGTTATETSGPAKHENGVWSPAEEIVREVLAEVSGIPAATIEKSNTIYHLGLDSISAIKAGSLLRKKGVAIGFRDMLKAGSITEMALLIRRTEQAPVDPPKTNGCNGSANAFTVSVDIDLPAILRQARIDRSNVEEVLPASPMQVHMLSVWQNTKGQVFYPTFTYAFPGQVDVTIISAAWQALVAGLPILRTVFVSTKSRSTPILQIVLRPAANPDTNASLEDTTWDSRATDDVSQPYNSLHAHRDGDRWILRLKIHHALYDAISLPRIMELFAALCSTNSVQNPVVHPFKWQGVLSRRLTEENLFARRQFWTEYLSGIESLSLHFRQQQEEEEPDSRISLIRPTALHGVSSISNLCKTKGISLQALFFAAYAQFLASVAVTNGKDKPDRVVFGIYLANRAEDSDPASTFYPFLRLLPLRVVLRSDASLVEIAVEVQRDIHAICAPVNAEVGLWEIKDWTGVTVDSFVNFLGTPVLPNEGKEENGVRLEVVGESVTNMVPSPAELGHEYKESAVQQLAENPVRDTFPVSSRVPPSSGGIHEMTADCP